MEEEKNRDRDPKYARVSSSPVPHAGNPNRKKPYGKKHGSYVSIVSLPSVTHFGEPLGDNDDATN
jgi:hypothetical protein